MWSFKQGYKQVPKLLQPSKYSRRQTDDMKQFHTDDAQLLGATVQKKNLARSPCSYFILLTYSIEQSPSLEANWFCS